MRKLIVVRVFAAALLALALPALAAAQGIEVGVGLASPITGRQIVTGAQVDSFGVLRANAKLDSSPQLFVELHKPFKLGEKFAIGPMVGFAPRVDFGMVGNTEAVQPVAVGFGVAVQIPSKLKQHINVGLAYVATGPVTQLADGYADGFQVPRGANGTPLGVQFQSKSLSRLMLTFTVSGWFR